MKRLLLSAAVASVVAVTGCMRSDFIKPSITQIDEYIQANPDLPEHDKASIYDGRFEIGIRQSTLEFLLGPPARLEIVQQPWAQQERWIYRRRGEKIFIIEDKHVVGILETER